MRLLVMAGVVALVAAVMAVANVSGDAWPLGIVVSALVLGPAAYVLGDWLRRRDGR